MHTIKMTPNLLLEYQCTSGKFIRLPNRIEKIDSVVKIKSKLFLPESECSTANISLVHYQVLWRRGTNSRLVLLSASVSDGWQRRRNRFLHVTHLASSLLTVNTSSRNR